MSVHNVLRRAGSLIAGVRRMVGGDEDTSLERLGETLTPILNPWGLPEWAALRGEQLYAVRLFQAAVAAEYGGIAINNPAGSNALVIVERISLSADTALTAFLELMLDTAISATYTVVTQPASVRDRRFRSTFGSIARFRQGTDLNNTFGAQLEQQTALTPTAGLNQFQVALPVVLKPGDSLAVIAQTVNLGLRACWGWRERKALPGELE